MDEKEEQIKTKFRDAAFLPACMLGMFFVSCGTYALMWVWQNETLTKLIFIICTIMLVIVPFILLVLLFFLYGLPVTIDEIGLHRSLFGKYLKSEVKWQEVKDIKVIKRPGTVVVWSVFSKTSLGNIRHLDRCLFRRDNIYLVYSEELRKTVMHYYGTDIDLV